MTPAVTATPPALLDYAELIRAVEAIGIPLPEQRLVRSAREAATFFAQVRKPVVLKLVSPGLVHKSDAGGVRLNLANEAAVLAAAAQLVELADSLHLDECGWRILVQEMAASSEVEIFVGLKRDKTFGPVVIVGAGGRLVELLPDRAIARCPVTLKEAKEMLAEIPLGKMLGGFRGAKRSFDAVAELICKVSSVPEAIAGLEEADFNPVLVTDDGPLAVDMRAVVSDKENAAPGDVKTATRDMRPLFEPQSVVVIGASASGAITPGNRVLNYLRERGYAGRVRAVHPKASEIGGYPAVPSIEALAGERIDLACVAVSASACTDVVSRLGAIGVRAAVVLSSGFSEMGNAKLEQELADAAKRSGMLLCGPNSIGVMSPGPHVHVCFSQAQDVRNPRSGSIALVTQSGALGGSLAAQAWQRGIGISRFVNVGNQALLTSADYLDYLAEDPATRTVALLLEGVTNGAALVRAVERLRSAGKSLVVLKVGRSAEGAKAVQSHTGSIAGDYAVYRAVLARAGATLVDSITEMLDVLQLKHAGVSVPRGTRIAIVSTSGGACAVVADACKRHGFPVPELSAELRAKLAEVLPGFASTVNPIDVTGQVVTEPAIYGRALEVVLRSDEIDAVTVMLTTIGGSQAHMIASEVVKHVVGQRKPVWVCWTMPSELAEEGIGMFAQHNIPVFDDPARAIGAAALSEAAHHG